MACLAKRTIASQVGAQTLDYQTRSQMLYQRVSNNFKTVYYREWKSAVQKDDTDN